MTDQFDIIAIGCVTMDYYFFLDAPLWREEKVKARSAQLMPGGTMGNFSSATAKLGAKTGFLGIVGEDAWGDLLIKDFIESGVDVSRILKRPDISTPLTILLLDNEGKRTNILPPFPEIRFEDIDLDYISKTKIIHTHLFDIAVFNYCAEKARKKNIALSIDMELHRAKQIPSPELIKIISLYDLVFLNRETLAWIAQSTDIETAAHSLTEDGPGTVIITLGDEGSFAVTPHEAIRMTPFKMTAVDTTGAGDAFAGAFCFGWLQGWPLKKTMEFSSAASALAVTKIGARTGQPTTE